jgi:L-asparaginase/beta-aspartyl-peptidase (threonine type)
MERSDHVFIAGLGASRFADQLGLERVRDSYFQPALSGHPTADRRIGTVGAVARDRAGRLAAATSTGGLDGKAQGRVGDSPILGAGCWADDHVAVSCTGVGEYFRRSATAHEISARMRLTGASLHNAAQAALTDIAALSGVGGLIAVDRDGNVSMPFLSAGMKRAFATSDGRAEALTLPQHQ